MSLTRARPGILGPGRQLAAIASIFFGARVCYFLAGVRFDSSTLQDYWQFIDPVLLHTRLIESLWYLQSQPPLFNLFLGLVLRLSGAHAPAVFHACYILCGLILVFCAHLLLERLGVRLRIRLPLVVLLAIAPADVLFENHLFYTYPLATALCLAALLLHLFLTHGRTAWGFAFFCVLGVVVLTGSMFHLLWLAAFVAVLLAARPSLRRKVLAASLLPLVLCAAWYAKNLYLFGSFTSCGWQGMNWALMAFEQMPAQKLDAMIASGRVTQLARIRPFSPFERYETFCRTTPVTGIPVLDEPLKSTGAINYNYLCYVHLAEQYSADAWPAIREFPRTYAGNYARAVFHYFFPASGFIFLQDNHARIMVFDRIFSAVIYGKFLSATEREVKIRELAQEHAYMRLVFSNALVLWLLYPALAAWGLLFVAHMRKREPTAANVVLFIVLNMGYVFLAGTAALPGENNRFRFMTEPLMFVLAGLALESFLGRGRVEHGSAGGDPAREGLPAGLSDNATCRH